MLQNGHSISNTAGATIACSFPKSDDCALAVITTLSAASCGCLAAKCAALSSSFQQLGSELGQQDACLGTTPRSIKQIEQLIEQHPLYTAADSHSRLLYSKAYMYAYRQARLNALEKVIGGLAQEKGAIVGRRFINSDALNAINSTIESYLSAQQDIINTRPEMRAAIQGVITSNLEIGVQRCLSAEVVASSFWGYLVGSVASKSFISLAALPFSRPEKLIEALHDLQTNQRSLVRDIFKERYDIDLIIMVRKVCGKGIREYAIDSIIGDKVSIASSGMYFLLSQSKKFRNGTRILQEFKRLLGDLNSSELEEVQMRFKHNEALKLGSLNLYDAAQARLGSVNFEALKSFLRGDCDSALAQIFKILLASPRRERREACDFLSELEAKRRCTMAARYGVCIEADIQAYLGHNLGLRDLALALIRDDLPAQEVARLWLGLHGDVEEWPGQPFLGKNLEQGAKVIARYDEHYGEGAFESRLTKYRGAEVYLIRALISSEVAPSSEIYFACTQGIGCDLDSLKLLVRSSSAEELKRDGEAFQRLWSERLTAFGRFVRDIAHTVLKSAEKRFSHDSPVVRVLGALTGRLQDVLWLESLGDNWIDLKIDLGGKTDDPTCLMKRACLATEHELTLPITRLFNLSLIKKLLPHAFDARKLSREAKALLDDYVYLEKCYSNILNKRDVHPDEILHFKAMVERIHIDRHGFRARKRYLSHFVASSAAGVSAATVGSLLLFSLKVPITTVLPIAIVTDAVVRCGVKLTMKGRRSYTWEEIANDSVHSLINGGTLYLRGVSKAFAAVRRILTNPLVERGADFAGKFLGKFTFGTLIRYMLYRKTANHTITPDELRRGMFVEKERKLLGQIFA